jgi:uncharacterized protein
MKRIDKLIPLVKPFYPGNDPSHDWPHIGRVVANARILAQDENLDMNCVLAAVYCHDLVNLPKNHLERKEASTLASHKAAPLLKEAGFLQEDIQKIQTAIIEHSFSKGLKPSTLEGAIVQDADRLDALGAIGILRCASVNTQMQSSFYDPFDPLAQVRELDDKKFMLDHYFVKLFKLPELMNTQKAKIIAIERVNDMKLFLEILMKEIKQL